MGTRARVVYWNNIPNPYMIDRFNLLGDSRLIDFEAWFSSHNEPGRDWVMDESEWRFRYRYLPTVQVWKWRCTLPVPLLRRPDLVVSLYADFAFVMGWFLMRTLRIKTVFWVLATFDSWVRRNPFREALKRLMFRNVDAFFTSGPDASSYVRRYAPTATRMFEMSHPIDVEFFASHSARAAPYRDRLRQVLMLAGVTFIYVGRLWSGKGVRDLIEAYAIVEQNLTDTSLLIVGSGPDEPDLRQLGSSLGLEGLRFHSFVQKQDLPALYGAADILVFPTLGDPYGHVVEEAMACGLPVISTFEAGEIRSRVYPGVNGFLVPAGNPTALAEKMLLLANDPAARSRLGQAAAAGVSRDTPARWCHLFEAAALQLISKAH